MQSHEKNSAPRRVCGRASRSVWVVCALLVLSACIAVGGTVAFLKQETGSLTNVFQLGDITYSLELRANAANANAKYADSDVSMPTVAPGVDQANPQSATQVVPAGHADFALSESPELRGYIFMGWGYNSAGNDVHIDASAASIEVAYGDPDTVSDTVASVLYAKWDPVDYRVVYNGNGSTDGSMEPSTHIYDEASSLTTNAYVKTGYDFLGWSEDSDAAVPTYGDGQSVINLASENDAEVDLYAVWKQKNLTVSFDTQTADVSNPSDLPVVFGEAYGDLPTVSRIGYDFDGWALDAAGLNRVTEETAVAVPNNHTLYAQWKPYSYTIRYENNVDPNDTSVTQPTGSTANSSHTYDEAKSLTPNGFSRTGYTFIGWNTKPDGTGASYANAESVKNLTSVKDDVVTLYAQWGVRSYVIRYHANGGRGTMADQVIEWDKLTELSKNAFTKEGDYSFAGWATSPDGDVVYLESQQVVNLQESGNLDLYAKWLLNSYTVTFDYNIGSGTPPTKEVLYGEEYGVLPPYLTTETENLFKGWYTAKEGGERVYPDTIVDRKEDHTLWAHWDPSPANDIIKDLIVHSSADDDNDGVADELHLEFRCSSSFEKFNIPLNNLVPGQKYALTYTTSNNASFGDYYEGYRNARYGSYILPTATEDAGNIDTAVAQDILATWYDREVPSNNLEIDDIATNDAFLNGPWENRTITFTATETTMYWAWEFGLMEDGPLYDYNIYDISLEPVAPAIEFGNKTPLKPSASNADIVSQTNGEYGTTFTFDGDGGCETVYYPITGLASGATYTIMFDHTFSGRLIDSSTYDYGCGIMNAMPADTAMGAKMSALGTWATNPPFVMSAVTGTTQSVTLTFKATGDTAYWVWNMANCSDSMNCTIDVKVTHFSATHASGSSITYYSAASQAALMLASRVESEGQGISLVYDDIDNTYLDAWYSIDEQEPVAGDDYGIAFEPMEGCSISETVIVTIDGVAYTVHTDGQSDGSDGMPSYDPETNVLTIPARLLTEETETVAVSASAIRAEADEAETNASAGEEPTSQPVDGETLANA